MEHYDDNKMTEYISQIKKAVKGTLESELEVLKMKKVRVFHGTAIQNMGPILQFGLKPYADEYAYVTTDRETAYKYAWSATGNAIFDGLQPDNLGVIVEFEVSGKDLMYDGFNLDEEMFQYKIEGISKENIINYETIVFEEFFWSNPERHRNIAKAVVFFGKNKQPQFYLG